MPLENAQKRRSEGKPQIEIDERDETAGLFFLRDPVHLLDLATQEHILTTGVDEKRETTVRNVLVAEQRSHGHALRDTTNSHITHTVVARNVQPQDLNADHQALEKFQRIAQELSTRLV